MERKLVFVGLAMVAGVERKLVFVGLARVAGVERQLVVVGLARTAGVDRKLYSSPPVHGWNIDPGVKGERERL